MLQSSKKIVTDNISELVGADLIENMCSREYFWRLDNDKEKLKNNQ